MTMAKRIYEGGILFCMAIILCSFILLKLKADSESPEIVQASFNDASKPHLVLKTTEQLQSEVKAICLRDNPQLFKNLK
jgi:hypothetical protein